jgi:hypothetical protein
MRLAHRAPRLTSVLPLLAERVAQERRSPSELVAQVLHRLSVPLEPLQHAVYHGLGS